MIKANVPVVIQRQIQSGPWHWSPDVLTAFATSALVLVGLAAALVALWQVFQARRLRREEAQPYVVVYTDQAGSDPTQIDLVAKNVGLTAATNVRIRFTPEPLSANLRNSNAPNALKVPEVIPVLVPGQEWRTYWDFTQARAEAEDLPRRYEVRVSFSDSRRRPITPEYVYEIDWQVLIDRGYITVYGLHDMAAAIRDVRDVLKNSGTGKLETVSFNGDKISLRRDREWRSKLRKQRVDNGKASRIDRALRDAEERWGRFKHSLGH